MEQGNRKKFGQGLMGSGRRVWSFLGGSVAGDSLIFYTEDHYKTFEELYGQ